ncbi:uncharacterized protein LOC101203040 [Cucumis sativus]|uniref:RRP15-like protein n=1 Tax=Cucumis sativus TaxID=3659 RepID=A0A0A0LGZ8_CUCSA|nr:uncharacterized protein LOC101203040 [Cucumis sativus]KGN61230.1 hypothetical protein Csa_006016 [Cucumis sativus]
MKGGHGALEVAKTVIEVADVAWSAIECCHNHIPSHDSPEPTLTEEEQLHALRSENRRLRKLLEQNLHLLQNISESHCLLKDCPPDLYARLVATVDSEKFLNEIKSLNEASKDGISYEFPFREATGADSHAADILVNVSHEAPSWWVWVTEDMVPNNVEEWSGIDDESYVIVSEEHVVEAVAHFMARCIMSNPKTRNISPEELQKAIAKALDGMGSKVEKMFEIWHAGLLFYSLATWGLALAGLYKGRAILKLAAAGVHHTSKAVMKVL